MEIVLAALVAAAVAGIVVIAGQRRGPAAAAAAHGTRSDGHRDSEAALVHATATAPVAASGGDDLDAAPEAGGSDAVASDAALAASHAPPAGGSPRVVVAAPPARAIDPALEAELHARRAEVARIEERLLQKEEALSVRLAELERKERSLEDRTRNLEQQAERLKEARQDQLRELERLSGLSAGQARQLLLRELEDELRHDRAVLARQVEDEVRRDAERRARSILSTAMQRIASGHAAETTVSVVQLPSDELKGRIIGREGRNIRALETLTGVDFIIDDTPSAVLLSGFDPVRREIARLTLERLIQDGRIHPARIEEAFEQAQEDIEGHIAEVGEQAALEANAGQISPELTKLLGRLHYRTSYGQNVLAHSIECANLAGMIAAELGASVKTARRAALLHDIGKAVSHEVEGPHALVGGRLARRYKETEAVAHAMEAHHGEVEMQTVEAVIVQVADSLSGARPGARGESLEQYVQRLRDLEEIARRHDGVDKVYAMQAGREIRVIVQPEQVDDERASLISHLIARDVESELEYPGQIKVTVIRESRSVDFAK